MGSGTGGRKVTSSQFNKIFDCLNEIPRGAGGEYQLTDAIKLLLEKEEVYAHKFQGRRYDTGSVAGYLRATVEFALDNPETKEVMTKIIKEQANKL